ncbi:hypothetical protein D4764_19G0005850 [Takifugu flavidus]|uniref:Alkylated DNA repair protein AlkB homologue 8 N-terminal domain-containing protein n=1 Tax=Takifugu flavidus TaxID=433684 RepID=A0A5C6NT71_9TELE|nr:hypothetical protein D4764_19G0005850 [Takifugu flavidus]
MDENKPLTAQQRMFFLRKLRKLNLPPRMLAQFYTAIIESILTSSITVDRLRLQRVVRAAEKVIGCRLPSIQDLYISRTRRCAGRLRSIRTRTSRYTNSFFPSAIRLLNTNAFNTIQPRLLGDKLEVAGVDHHLTTWILDYLTQRPQFVRIVCWSSSITDRDRKRMDRLVRRASSVLGCPLDSVEVVGNGRMMAKLSSMLNNTSHPLQDTLTALGSSFSERLLHPRCVKERYRRSFLPAAVRLHNKHNNR